MAFTNTIRKILTENPEEIKPAMEAAKEVIKGRIKILGSGGRV